MTTNAYLFAVRDATLESAGAIRLAYELARTGVVSNLIVYFRTRQTARLRARADCHRLYGRYRHDCLREKSVEFQVPGRVRAQSGYEASGCDFKDAAERVA